MPRSTVGGLIAYTAKRKRGWMFWFVVLYVTQVAGGVAVGIVSALYITGILS